MDDDAHLFMFGTSENLSLLEVHDHWFIDGTFKVSPAIYTQLFTVHAFTDNSANPLIYVLMNEKTQVAYERGNFSNFVLVLILFQL